ncbi:DUF3034 family protein [Allohahella marinimesophila]|uniref:DUF3034 family protein n=2 Tax=Allohahella marinimesophila TaxID=1054972 RepID=A0ABP7PV91_9GAMM
MQALSLGLLVVSGGRALALDEGLQGSKLLGTAGAVNIEGSGGGGLVPWAFIGGYGSDDEVAATVSASMTSVDDFGLRTTGLLVGFHNRLELSLAKQWLRVDPLALTITQHVVGAKLRLSGDVVYGTMPQFSAGLQYKRNTEATIPYALGADDNAGVDVYLAASKVWLNALLGRNLALSATARYTEANQGGLLGFGAVGERPQLVGEASLAIFLNRYWAMGVEYRQKPDNLAGVREHDWRDVFIGWFPSKSVSIVTAYTDLGSVAGQKQQEGLYLSVHLNTGNLK